MKEKWFVWGCVVHLILLGTGCTPEPDTTKGEDLTHIEYHPEPYDLPLPKYFPDLVENADNPLTQDGVQLGRHLFYDPILSLDSSISCSSCHQPHMAFTDGQSVSKGVGGLLGHRSAMSLVNMGFLDQNFFWDGRSPSLEHQALEPVENPVEQRESWDNVEQKLQRHPLYQVLFRKAFGIENSKEIDRGFTAKALAQFQRIIISSNAKFDKEQSQLTFFTAEEQRGFDMYFDTSTTLPDAECAHCHSWPLFGSSTFFNNGVQEAGDIRDYADKGRGAITEYVYDNGLFRAPTLRNIALTAPYMHDGRFETLDEVLDHYNSGGHFTENVDPLIRPLGLTDQQKKEIIAFLKTLTDTSYLKNPDVLSPF